ncbi:hypothetical protein ABRG53_3919 [Pseudanabaena sp. ABRG5-3]|nr:hypothetical protein ABRG53_3919 [Pseudanabaena sp. ABRG5-3]
MTLKLTIIPNIVSSLFCRDPLIRLPSPYGYANFGFKAIASNGQRYKYGDRNLYTVIPRSKPQNVESQQLDYRFELIQSFSIQKAGNAIAECEDIWRYAQGDRQISIALSDGATESSFAKEWAKELVTAFVNLDHGCIPEQNLQSWLQPVQQTWQQWLGKQNLTWFAKRKAGAGAFATFLGLEILPDLSWQALATGDSCLFIVRQQKSCLQFPIQNSDEFNHRPKLIGTYTEVANIRMNQANGVAELGDRFYLTTDAIACWIFKQIEASQDPWVKLGEINSQDEFSQWVNELRDRHEIANDDTTLLCLEIRRES